MKALKQAISRFVDRSAADRRFVAAFVILMTLLAIAGVTRVEFDDEPRKIFERDDAAFAQLEQLYDHFGADDNDVLLVMRSDTLFTDRVLSAIRDLLIEVRIVPGITNVTSIFDVRRVGSTLIPLMPTAGASQARFDYARMQALKHPLVAGQLLSPDARTMLAMVRLGDEAPTTDEIEPILTKLRQTAVDASRGEDLQVWLAGHPSIRVDNLVGLRKETF